MDSVGNKVGELRYHPYGVTRYSWGSTPTGYRFTGQREDATIGLYFYNARYYDPALGRFISADTVVPEPGEPQSLNRYSYVVGNPLRYNDPSDHTKWEPPTPSQYPYDITAFELGWLWLAEQCPEYMVFNENYELTRSLMHDEGVNQARAQFYQKLQEGTLENGTDDTYGYRYLVIPYIREAVQYVTGDDRIGFYLGSYSVHTHLNTEKGSVTFIVEDPKTWESGTRSPFYYVPDFIGPTLNPILPESLQLRRSKHSVEDLIMDPGQFNFPSDIFIASLLSSRSRSAPGLFSSDIHLGGSIHQKFTWTEPLQVDQGE